MCCAPPFGTVRHRILPVFKPNDYFWKHYWKPGEDKAQVFANAVRQVMLEAGGFKDTDNTAESRFEYLKAYRGVSDIQEE